MAENKKQEKTATNASEAPVTREKVSREPLFGKLLLSAMILFLALATAGIGWAIYESVHRRQVENNEPSIAALKDNEALSENVDKVGGSQEFPASPAAPITDQTAVPGAADAKKIEVSVLNGGGAKGSAGVLAESLKKEGYASVTAGNTASNYTGVVIYYADSAASSADALKASVMKTYPSVATAKAVATNKETTASPLTVIIGK